VVLNRGGAPQGGSINFKWSARRCVANNMESSIIKFTNKYCCFHSFYKVRVLKQTTFTSGVRGRKKVKNHCPRLQSSGSQTFMIHGPLLNLTGEYLIYRDTWVMQITTKLFSEDLCSWHPENRSVDPKGTEGPFWETLV